MKCSIEQRQKISLSMKKAHAEKRHPGWTHVNADPNRMSYPERCMIQNMKSKGLFDKYTFVIHFPIGKYFLDFALIDFKIDIEVDGGQHKTEEAILHDKERDLFLVNEGWRVYRISWDELQEKRELVVDELLVFIESLDNTRTYTIGEIRPVKLPKYGKRTDYYKAKEKELRDAAQTKILQIENSNIDFGKFGWATKVAKILQLHPQKVVGWMRRYMPDFYQARCFKTKRCIMPC